MASLTIGDHTVTVDDGFLKLSPDQQNATVEEIAKSLGPKVKSPGIVGGAIRSAATGVPIIGGLLNKADAATDAALAPVMNRFFPEKDQLKGDFGQRYAQALGVQEGEDKAFYEAHPVIDTGAKIAGAVGSLGAAAGTDLGAAALGLAGKTLPGMMAGGAVSGAGIGALDATARGEDPTTGALVGAAGGAAGPVIGKAVGAAVKPFVRFAGAAATPEIEAAGQIRSALEKDAGKGLSQQELAAAGRRDQPITLMDQGARATQRLARRASNVSPEAQEALGATTQSRFLTQSPRTAEYLGQISNYPDAEATAAALKRVTRTVNGRLYSKAMEKGAGGVWSDRLEQLINHPWVKKALPEALEQSNAEAVLDGRPPLKNPFVEGPDGRLTLPKGVKPTLEFWDAVKKSLDGRVEGATATATSRGDPNTVRMGTNLLHALTGELDRAVPEYATARDAAKRLFGARDALSAGRQTAMPNTVASRATNRTLRDTMLKMSPEEKKLFQQGFIDQTIETLLGKPDSFNVLRAINANPKARERMLMILGPDKHAGLEAFLRVEGKMDQFRTAIGGNSTTAQQLGDMSEGSVVPKIRMSMMRMVEDWIHGQAAKIGIGVDERVARKIGEMLTSSDGKEYAKALNIITKNKNLMKAIRQPDAAYGAIGVRGVSQGLQAQPQGQ